MSKNWKVRERRKLKINVMKSKVTRDITSGEIEASHRLYEGVRLMEGLGCCGELESCLFLSTTHSKNCRYIDEGRLTKSI